MTYLLGIDVGTSGSKALLIDESGAPRVSHTEEYAMATPRPLWAEQDPEDWWAATCRATRSVIEKAGVSAKQVVGVGLTGQMHGLVLLDKNGAVLRPCIMWNDQRTGEQCAAITAKVGAREVLELTGNPVLPGFTAPKIAWVRENEPAVYERIAKVLLPKDYVRYRLTGAFVTEVSDASGMALLDVANRQWSETMLDALDIPREWLPDVNESVETAAKINSEGAGGAGLAEGTPVAGGGGDQAAQAVGTGIIDEGTVSVTLGTSGVVFAASDSYRAEPEGKLHAFCHAVPGKWHLMGVMLSAAGSFRWYRDTLGQEEQAMAERDGRDAFEILTEQAEKAPAGCEGLLFLPYLSGERTPHPDPHARGAFIGLSLRHQKNHMTRAVLEGVTYGLRDSLELMRDLGIHIDQVRASGGGAKSPFWLQLLADNFHSGIHTVDATEGAAFGAALLAGVGAGTFSSVADACASALAVRLRAEPGENALCYDDFYPSYRALYPALRNEFSTLAKVVESRWK